MPRTKLDNARVRADRRAQILQAAVQVVARRGLAATTITDIATAAGISLGLAYHYFTNKDAVVAAVVEQSTQGTIRLVEQAQAQDGTPWERLRWLTQQLLPVPEDRTAADYLLVQLAAATQEPVPADVQDMLTRQAVVIRTTVHHLICDGSNGPGDDARWSGRIDIAHGRRHSELLPPLLFV